MVQKPDRPDRSISTAVEETPGPDQYNAAAILLLSAAPAPMLKIAEETCQRIGCQPWHLIVGHLLKADQRAELHAPLLLDEWTVESGAPAERGQHVCPSCKRAFTPPEDRADAKFCCNFCGSGRFQRDQLHHRDCQFYVQPKANLALAGRIAAEPDIPPTGAKERLLYELRALERHQAEVLKAEATPGGLPPVPDLEAGTQTGDGQWA